MFVLAALVCGLVAAPSSVRASGGATDPIPGTSKSGLSTGGGTAAGGGGGGKKSTPVPAPAPAPAPVLPAGPITFLAAGSVNGIVPNCIGDYRMQAYYPTLLDMTVNVSVDSLNVPDGTVLYVNLIGGLGGTLYPYSSNMIVIIGGVGICSEKAFVTLGGSLAGVTVTDFLGNVVFAGN